MKNFLPLSLLSLALVMAACGAEAPEAVGETDDAVITTQFCQNVFDAMPGTFIGEAPMITVTYVSGKNGVLIQDMPGLENSGRIGMYGNWQAARSEFGPVSGTYALVVRKRFVNLAGNKIQTSSILDFQLTTQAGANWASWSVIPTECSSNGRQVTITAVGPDNGRLTAVLEHFYIGG